MVEPDIVCRRDCVATLENALTKIDGVKAAERDGDQFHFRLDVLENKSVLPSAILQVTDKIRTESKGEEDFPLLSFESMLAGTVDGAVFTAPGSGQKYTHRPGEALKGFRAAGKTRLKADRKGPRRWGQGRPQAAARPRGR